MVVGFMWVLVFDFVFVVIVKRVFVLWVCIIVCYFRCGLVDFGLLAPCGLCLGTCVVWCLCIW